MTGTLLHRGTEELEGWMREEKRGGGHLTGSEPATGGPPRSQRSRLWRESQVRGRGSALQRVKGLEVGLVVLRIKG